MAPNKIELTPVCRIAVNRSETLCVHRSDAMQLQKDSSKLLHLKAFHFI